MSWNWFQGRKQDIESQRYDASANTWLFNWQTWGISNTSGIEHAKNVSASNGMNFKSGGMQPNAIAAHSAIYINPHNLKPRFRQNVDTADYLSGEYQGFGSGVHSSDIDTETDLRFGNWNKQPRSIATLNERPNTYSFSPLIHAKSQDMQNSRLFIQEENESTWVRGGIDSRQEYKSNILS